jgi:hypothetical protein
LKFHCLGNKFENVNWTEVAHPCAQWCACVTSVAT